LGVAGDFGGNSVQVGQPAVLLVEGHGVGLGAGEHGADGINGVGGVGDEGYVTGVEEAEGHVADAFLGSDEGEDFLVRVQVGDAEALLIPGGNGAPNLRRAVGLGVAVVNGVT